MGRCSSLPCSAFYVPWKGEKKKKGARERLRGKKESQRERRESGGDDFGVSNNVRRIDSEGDLLSLLIPHRAADHSSSLALARSGGEGPALAPATLPRLIEACCCK